MLHDLGPDYLKRDAVNRNLKGRTVSDPMTLGPDQKATLKASIRGRI